MKTLIAAVVMVLALAACGSESLLEGSPEQPAMCEKIENIDIVATSINDIEHMNWADQYKEIWGCDY